MIDLVEIEAHAKHELEQEEFRRRVEERKIELRTKVQRQSLWQRLANKLPFTVKIERRTT